MEFKEGYVYHIKDSYFEKADDNKLMKNKENGNFRPTFYCLKDEKTSLLWVVPMSSKIEKYQKIVNKQTERYGKALGIYIGTFDGKSSAFLIQNMFPITDEYLDHIHTRNGNPVPVKESVKEEVKSRMQKARQLVSRGKKVVFPDIIRLEKLMIEEISISKVSQIVAASAPVKKAPFSRAKLSATAQSIKQQSKSSSDKNKVHKKDDPSL